MTPSVALSPLGNRILVRYRPLPETTGLILRVQRDEYCRWADVLAVGPEVRDVKVGWGVLVPSLSGQVVGEDVILLESAVLAYEEVQ